MLTNFLDFDIVTVGRYVPDSSKKTYVYPGDMHGVSSFIPRQAVGGLVDMYMDKPENGSPHLRAKIVFFPHDKAMEIFRGLRDNAIPEEVVVLVTPKALFLMEKESALEIEKSLAVAK